AGLGVVALGLREVPVAVGLPARRGALEVVDPAVPDDVLDLQRRAVVDRPGGHGVPELLVGAGGDDPGGGGEAVRRVPGAVIAAGYVSAVAAVRLPPQL